MTTDDDEDGDDGSLGSSSSSSGVHSSEWRSVQCLFRI